MRSDKTKLRLLIRTYLLFNERATASELSKWLNKNFKWRKEVTPNSIGGLLAGYHYQGYLDGLCKDKRPLDEGGIYEYYLKEEVKR